jgi:hypothetical protein
MKDDLPLKAEEAIQFMIAKMMSDLLDLYPDLTVKNFIHHIQYGCAIHAYKFFNYNQEAEEFLTLAINEAKKSCLLKMNE